VRVLVSVSGREVVTPIEARRELSVLHSTSLYFTSADCDRANELIDIINEAHMATKTIGRTKVTTTKTGKVKVAPIITAPKTARIAKAKKADRAVKGLVANRSASKAKAPAKRKAG